MPKQRGLYDEFEIKGYWRLPSEPQREIAGNLSFSMEGINLSLFGILGNPLPFQQVEDKYEIILGRTEDGDVTLIDGFQVKQKMSGITSSELTFNKMIIGKHFNSKEDIKFHSAQINYSYIEQWMGHHPFEDEMEMDGNGKLISAGINYSFPPIFEANVKSIGATIKANYFFSTSGERYRSKTFEHKGSLQVIPDEEQGLDWFLDITAELQNLLTLLMNRAVYPKMISAKGDVIISDRQIRENIQIYILPMREFKEKDINVTERFIAYKVIEDKIENVISNWFSDKNLKSSVLIYLRNLYDIGSQWEIRFLDYAKSVESFHRDTVGNIGKFKSDEEYAPIKQAMIDAIPKDIGDLKSKLISSLQYAHHFGFQRRVRETLLNLDEELKDLMFDDAKKLKDFAQDVTNTRDYYTHFGDLPDYCYKEWDLYLANHRLHVILFYNFCKRLGIPADILQTVITQNDKVVHWLQTAKKELKN